MTKTILAQGDCALDSLDVFKVEFLSLLGETIASFKNKAIFKDDFTLTWTKGDYKLSIAPDDPYYRLDLIIKN